MSVCCECCVLTGRGLFDELLTCPEESYPLWCVECDLEKSGMRRRLPTGALAPKTNKQTNKQTKPLNASQKSRTEICAADRITFL